MPSDSRIPRTVFTTPRLTIRFATIADLDLYFALWTDPRVMSNVGFPQGLPVTREQIAKQIAACGDSEFDRLLIVALTATGQAIGECKLGQPDSESIAVTDVKLLPAFWGHKYGVEVKRGLLDYLFTHTDCIAVEATPNVGNIASIRMQEAVGGIRIGEASHHFPESMRAYTAPVHHYIYRVSRSDWLVRVQIDPAE